MLESVTFILVFFFSFVTEQCVNKNHENFERNEDEIIKELKNEKITLRNDQTAQIRRDSERHALNK